MKSVTVGQDNKQTVVVVPWQLWATRYSRKAELSAYKKCVHVLEELQWERIHTNAYLWEMGIDSICECYGHRKTK